jgi:hypothetical protein
MDARGEEGSDRCEEEMSVSMSRARYASVVRDATFCVLSE